MSTIRTVLYDHEITSAWIMGLPLQATVRMLLKERGLKFVDDDALTFLSRDQIQPLGRLTWWRDEHNLSTVYEQELPVPGVHFIAAA